MIAGIPSAFYHSLSDHDYDVLDASVSALRAFWHAEDRTLTYCAHTVNTPLWDKYGKMMEWGNSIAEARANLQKDMDRLDAEEDLP